MRDRHRRILVEQQLHQRTADQIGAADHDRIHAFQRGMHALGQDDAAERRAWRQRGKAAGEPAGIVRMQAVDILGRIDGVDDGFGVDRFRQRQLHENAVHRGIAVELCDQRQQIGLRDVGGQLVLERGHAGGLGLLVLAADIDLAGGIVADQHHRKARRELMLALDPRDLVGDAGAKLRCNDFSVDNACRHLNPSSSPCFAAAAFRSVSPSILGSPSTATCLRREVVPDRIFTLRLRHAEHLRQQFGHRAVGLAAIGDGADANLDHGAAVGERFNSVDIVAAAARRHPQRDADALGGIAPRIHQASIGYRRLRSDDVGIDVIERSPAG